MTTTGRARAGVARPSSIPGTSSPGPTSRCWEPPRERRRRSRFRGPRPPNLQERRVRRGGVQGQVPSPPDRGAHARLRRPHLRRLSGAARPESAESTSRLRDALTINVTRFYRNAETWNLLRRNSSRSSADPSPVRSGPGAPAAPRARRPIPSPCSCADAVRARRPLPASSSRFTVDATDIDRESLERAQGGALPSRDPARDAAQSSCRRYFEPAGPELEVVTPNPRARPGAHPGPQRRPSAPARLPSDRLPQRA